MSHPVSDALSKAIGSIRADDDMLELLKALESLGPKHIEDLEPAEARLQPTIADAVRTLLQQRGEPSDPQSMVPGVSSRDTTLQGAAGLLGATIYTPDGPGPFPLVVYFHGGGWVIADRHVYDGGARGLSAQARAIVVSVDYRQSPEAKFPAAWDDALAAYRWVAENALSLGGDPHRIAIAGESAGGNLALATAVAVRDAGLPVQPRHVLAVYPVTQTSVNTESYIENAIAKPLNRAMVQWFVKHLLRSDADLKDTRLQLIDAKLAGLPSVTIINAKIDPLRNDGSKIEGALRDAGVQVERRDFDGVTHEFFGCAAVLKKAREAQHFAGERLKASFTR